MANWSVGQRTVNRANSVDDMARVVGRVMELPSWKLESGPLFEGVVLAPKGNNGDIGPAEASGIPGSRVGDALVAVQYPTLHGLGEHAPLAPLPDLPAQRVLDDKVMRLAVGESELDVPVVAVSDPKVKNDFLLDGDFEVTLDALLGRLRRVLASWAFRGMPPGSAGVRDRRRGDHQGQYPGLWRQVTGTFGVRRVRVASLGGLGGAKVETT